MDNVCVLGHCADSVKFLEATSYSIPTIYDGVLGLSFYEKTKDGYIKPVCFYSKIYSVLYFGSTYSNFSLFNIWQKKSSLLMICSQFGSKSMSCKSDKVKKKLTKKADWTSLILMMMLASLPLAQSTQLDIREKLFTAMPFLSLKFQFIFTINIP